MASDCLARITLWFDACLEQLLEEDVDDGAGEEGGGRLRDGVVAQAALDQALGEGGRPAQLGQVLLVDGVLEEEGHGRRQQPELELHTKVRPSSSVSDIVLQGTLGGHPLIKLAKF